MYLGYVWSSLVSYTGTHEMKNRELSKNLQELVWALKDVILVVDKMVVREMNSKRKGDKK